MSRPPVVFRLALTFAKHEAVLSFLNSNINIAVETLWMGSILFRCKESNCFGLGGRSRADFP